MKKYKLRLIAAALALLLALALTSCGKKALNDEPMDFMSPGEVTSPSAPSLEGDISPDVPYDSWDATDWDSVGEGVGQAVKPGTSLAEKIIYSASIQIETVDFDGAVETIDTMLTHFGAFLESSSVSGRSYNADYYGYKNLRVASYVIRVPVESFKDMTGAMSDVGRVLSTNVYTDNITERYYDTDARAQSYRIEQERLLAMLEKCETVTEMIEIESRLSQVRYELESLESTLRNWQNEVDYSTITVTISEVEELTRVTEPHRTYWQQIGDGFADTLRGVGGFFMDLFKWVIVNLPVIIIVVLIAAAAVLVIARIFRRRRRVDDTKTGSGDGADEE